MSRSPSSSVVLMLVASALLRVGLVAGQDAPCNYLDCVSQPVPPPPSQGGNSVVASSPSPAYSYTAPPPPSDAGSPPPPPDAASPTPSDVYTLSPPPPETYTASPLPPSDSSSPTYTASPLPPDVYTSSSPSPGAMLCSDPPYSSDKVNVLTKWCEIDPTKLWIQPKNTKPRYFPGVVFLEGFGSPHKNESKLQVDYYPAQGRYVMRGAYDSGDDQPFSLVELDLTLGLLRTMPFTGTTRPPAVTYYDLKAIDPSVLVALSTRTNFGNAFRPLSDAFDFLILLGNRFQAPYNPPTTDFMPMQRANFCPELYSIVEYLIEMRTALAL